MFARHVFYEGRVQGVGFRYTVKSLASEYEVSGWVRNLPDGRVELQALATEEDELAAFLQEILDSRLRHHIKGVESRAIAPPAGILGECSFWRHAGAAQVLPCLSGNLQFCITIRFQSPRGHSRISQPYT